MSFASPTDATSHVLSQLVAGEISTAYVAPPGENLEAWALFPQTSLHAPCPWALCRTTGISLNCERNPLLSLVNSPMNHGIWGGPEEPQHREEKLKKQKPNVGYF